LSVASAGEDGDHFAGLRVGQDYPVFTSYIEIHFYQQKTTSNGCSMFGVLVSLREKKQFV
jgi:hypothetical protein